MDTIIQVPVKVYSESRHGLPQYAKMFDSGMDVRVNLVNPDEPLIIPQGGKVIIPTGLYFAIPSGYEFQVRPRSGTSYKTTLKIANSPGTIDATYRGELGLIVENTGVFQLVINDGDRIAQIVLAPVVQCVWQTSTSKELLGTTDRGEGGFGSTGHD
jgi:dUTP pyrophosphatase